MDKNKTAEQQRSNIFIIYSKQSVGYREKGSETMRRMSK